MALAVAVLAALYVAAPTIGAGLAPWLAAPLGLDDLRLRVGRPGPGGVSVRLLELRRGRLRVVAVDGHFDYRLGRLLAGRLRAVSFRRVTLRLEDEPASRAGTAPAAAQHGQSPPDAPALFAALPAERLHVETLEVVIPAVDFRAAGPLDVEDGHADVRLQASSPRQAERLVLAADADTSGSVSLRIGGQDSAGPAFVTVTSALDGRDLEAHGGIDLRGFALDLVAAVAGMPAGDGHLSGTFTVSLPWPPGGALSTEAKAQAHLAGEWRARTQPWAVTGLVADVRWLQGVVSGAAAGSVGAAGSTLPLRMEIAELNLDPGTGHGALLLPAEGGGEALADLSWTLQRDALEVDGRYRLRGGPLTLAARAAGLPAGDGDLGGRLSLHLPRPLPDGGQNLAGVRAQGSLGGGWRAQSGELGVQDLDAQWRLEENRLSGSLQGRVSVPGLQMQAGLEFDAATLADGAIEARGTAAAGTLVRLPFEAVHRLDSGSGRVSVAGDVKIGKPLAADVVIDWAAPWDVTAGIVTVRGSLGWGPRQAAADSLSVRLDDVAAHYQDYRLAGLDGTLSFAQIDASWSLPPSRLRAREADTGVELRDIDSGVAWSGTTLTVQPTTARLLGGNARVDTFAYAIDSGRADLVVDLEGLSLARILALEGGHVSGSGTLNGSLPVQVRDHLPNVVAGRLRADPSGGEIHVAPAIAGATGQPGLDFALRALEDFRYSVLQADVAYGAGGDLTLGVHLEGRNPAVEKGRPIHYNLDLNENVPTLLKSLRLQDEVTRKIEQRVTD